MKPRGSRRPGPLTKPTWRRSSGHSATRVTDDGPNEQTGASDERRSRDEEREQRITMEIVVDAYTPEEQAMGWYSSLEDRRHFPFVARCIAQRSISPLRLGDQVEVVAMAPKRSASTRCSS
jgi:hypothetical protein